MVALAALAAGLVAAGRVRTGDDVPTLIVRPADRSVENSPLLARADVESRDVLVETRSPPRDPQAGENDATAAAAPLAPPLPDGLRVGRTVLMEVTAYCPCKICCGPLAHGVTASGEPVEHNGGQFVAADRRLPFGTQLRVPGYAGGVVVPVLDRGGAIRGRRLDVFFPTHAEARRWGRQTLPVQIIEPAAAGN